jgi:hypothetical protein
MNNNSVLGQVVSELTRPVKQQNRQRRKKKKNPGKPRAARPNPSSNAGGARGYRDRNPGMLSDNTLSLTRDQFTATSPLNLIEVRPGSTPGGVRVKGRELLAGLSTASSISGAYTVLTNNRTGTLNTPIIPSTFPRLGNYGGIYEFYKFHKLCLFFYPNQPTTQAGEILACVDYDAKDLTPVDAASVMRNITATMSNIYSLNSMEMLASLSRLPKFITSSTTSVDVDQTTQGIAYYVVEGVTASAGATLGYLVAQYEVEFYTPQ